MPARPSEMAIGRGILQGIFAVFLGLMITAVVGVGVYTFHPSPAVEVQEQIDALYQQRGQVDGCTEGNPSKCRSWDQLTESERAEIERIDAQVAALNDRAKQEREAWSQSTSIILVTIATALMAISLLLGESLTVLSNGILLGGLFTMLYGVGWGLASGNSLTRFLVLVVALLVSILLGYLKFVRGRDTAPSKASAASANGPAAGTEEAGAPPEVAALADLAARVADLEGRLSGVAALLAAPGEPGDRDAAPGT
jgi:hypothetical protein